MKTLKRKVIFPVMVMGLGVFGAFVGTAHTSNAFSLEFGYVETDEPCDTRVDCDTTGEEACTVVINNEEQEALGKLSPTSDCNIPLYRPQSH